MKNPFLVGTHIYLRPLEREDALLIVPWINDVEVTRTLALFSRPTNLQAEIEFLDQIYKSEHDVVLGITVKETNTLIGATGLHAMDFKNRHTTFGIFIGEKSEWGKGYGTEATALMTQYAFATLNMHRVWFHVYEYNARGIRTYEKLGFTREGVLRQHHYAEGRYWNVIMMAMLREEWEARRSQAG